MPLTPEEIAAQNAALEKENADLKALVAEKQQREQIEQLAKERADEVVARTTDYVKQIDTAVQELVQKRVAEQMPYGLATILGKMTVTPTIEFPHAVVRAGNLSPADKQLADILLGRKTALSSTSGTHGDEWVPTALSTELIGLVESYANLGGFIRTIDMPTNPFDIPTVTADHTVYYASAENAAATADGTPTTSKVTLTAKKFISQSQISTEITEDSILPVLQMIKENAAFSMARAEESAMVWGDDTTTAASNIDKNVSDGTVTSPQQAFNGIYYMAKTGSTPTFLAYATSWPATIRSLRAAMGKYGIRPSECVVLMSPAILTHCQADSNFTTWDKVGAAAVALTGQLPNASAANPYGLFDGMFVTVSDFMYDTDATGVRLTTAASNVKHTVAIFNRNRLVIGRRRGISLKVVDYPLNDTVYLVSTSRCCLGFFDAAASGAYVAGYNG